MNLSILKELLTLQKKIVIYGAGFRGNIIVRNIKAFGLNPIAIVDRNPDKQGGKIFGIRVEAPSYLETMDDDTTILVSLDAAEGFYNELKEKYECLPYEAAELFVRLSYLNCEEYGYNCIENIGSYMSPYPDKSAFEKISAIESIDLNMQVQREWFQKCLDEYQKIEKKSDTESMLRYYEDNTKYGIIDALVLYTMLKTIKPRSIIEVGSGFSSAIILDTNEYCLDGNMNMIFVEPYPARLKSLLKENDRIVLHECFLEDLDLDICNTLQEGDVLFIDSSHMSKRGSDVNKVFFEVLPRLKSGVYIHIHDIFKDFEYPRDWLEQGWVWNECYILRAFLMNNHDYEIVFFCDMWNEEFEKTKMFEKFVGGANIWLRKK